MNYLEVSRGGDWKVNEILTNSGKKQEYFPPNVEAYLCSMCKSKAQTVRTRYIQSICALYSQ
jgi:hypothetical protein